MTAVGVMSMWISSRSNVAETSDTVITHSHVKLTMYLSETGFVSISPVCTPTMWSVPSDPHVADTRVYPQHRECNNCCHCMAPRDTYMRSTPNENPALGPLSLH